MNVQKEQKDISIKGSISIHVKGRDCFWTEKCFHLIKKFKRFLFEGWFSVNPVSVHSNIIFQYSKEIIMQLGR